MSTEKTQKKFSESLKNIRMGLRLSQKEMASNLELAVSTYQHYERGEREAPISIIPKITALGVSMNWLLTGEGDPFPKEPGAVYNKEWGEAALKESEGLFGKTDHIEVEGNTFAVTQYEKDGGGEGGTKQMYSASLPNAVAQLAEILQSDEPGLINAILSNLRAFSEVVNTRKQQNELSALKRQLNDIEDKINAIKNILEKDRPPEGIQERRSSWIEMRSLFQ